jgi:hypothetical protein
MNSSDKKYDQFERVMGLRKMMGETGAAGDLLAEFQWEWSLSPLANGRHAEKFQQRLENHLGPRLLAKQFQPEEIISAAVPKELAILLCLEQLTNQRLIINRDSLTGHLLVVGTTGSGKTSFIVWIITQLLRQGIRIVFHDHKGEGRRLLHSFSNAMVFRPEQEFYNPLEPIGPTEMYWTALFAEFGRAFNLHAETWTELTPIMQRIVRSLKPGQAFPSWRDLAFILLNVAGKEHRPKLITLANAILSLAAVQGRSAVIRRAPDMENRYRLIVYEYQQLPPRIHHFLSAVRLLRSQMKAMSQGHGHHLREIFVSDEAALEFGEEFSSVAGSNYVPIHKRIITQNRSFGSGVIAGAQMLSTIDSCLKSNAATVVCFRCPNPKEAREAQQLLLLPDEAVPQIMSLPTGTFFVRSVGLSRTALATFPKVELGAYPSDEEVSRRLAAEFAWLEQHTIFSPAKPDDAEPLSYLEILGEAVEPPTEASSATEAIPKQFFAEHRALLLEIRANPTASVTEHYEQLKWSAGRGNRVKDQLLAMGLICSAREKSANGRPREILILTDKSKTIMHENL